MQTLYDRSGWHACSAAYADALHERLEQQWARENNLKPAGGFTCVQRLLGKQCGISRQKSCDCQPPGTDHPSLWLKDGKPYYYISQPYHFEMATLGELNVFCQQHGLEYRITTWPSFYYPSGTMFVLFRVRQ